MKLVPFTKRVEIEAGYRGFYRLGTSKYTITVEENGIGILIDQRTGHPLDRGEIVRLFKPMISLWAGRKYVESMGEMTITGLQKAGFIELGKAYL